jgi:hypothetical protein
LGGTKSEMRETVEIWDVWRPIRITGCDENKTKLTRSLFRLSIVMTFVQGDSIQSFNPFGENCP